ncbi:pseudouridine synthase [Oxobacter pfennigii]|uniref:pseudouridine synthase n=1 Tax=Oxobacter pfennigii TaxID=36849 RepID=UPI0006D3B306|nr:pseudouridine synthase [Oxobacter pfennigii]
MEERLQKFLARSGIASRRKCEELIKEGTIKVNGVTVTDMGIKIDSKKDVISYKDKVITINGEKVYIILNKPCGYITTTKEQFNRKKVTDLISGISIRVYPVGRLDYDTSGLLILTNDGDLTYKLTHPAHEVNKTYIAEVIGIPDESKLDKLRQGIPIEDYVTSPAQVNIIDKNKSTAILEITIHEGKNRQVRKMCSAIGHEVKNLKRAAIGNLKLNDLALGKWRYLSEEEINYLRTL